MSTFYGCNDANQEAGDLPTPNHPLQHLIQIHPLFPLGYTTSPSTQKVDALHAHLAANATCASLGSFATSSLVGIPMDTSFWVEVHYWGKIEKMSTLEPVIIPPESHSKGILVAARVSRLWPLFSIHQRHLRSRTAWA